MLSFFRKFIKSRVGLVVVFLFLGIIAVAFGLTGGTGLPNTIAGTAGELVKVGNQSITEDDVRSQIETGKRISALPNLPLRPQLVMVTAYGREEVLKQAEENAFANVLIKPVTPSMLFDSAIEVLGADQEKVYDVQPAPAVELSVLRGARVLLAEDNELNQEVALGLLKDMRTNGHG